MNRRGLFKAIGCGIVAAACAPFVARRSDPIPGIPIEQVGFQGRPELSTQHIPTIWTDSKNVSSGEWTYTVNGNPPQKFQFFTKEQMRRMDCPFPPEFGYEDPQA